MMKFIIVDDEPPARERMRHLMTAFDEFEYVGEAENGLDAVNLIEASRPDLVFLDIEMPGLDGFDVIRQLSPSSVPIVIFVTAFDQYAIKAFEVEALDYLVKPVSPERLETALQRVLKMKRKPIEEHIDSINRIAVGQKRPLARIPVRKGHGITLLNFGDICFFHFEDRIVFVQTARKRYPTHFESLKELEARLLQQDFLRINRNCLVNLNQISEIIPYGRSLLKIVMNECPEIALDVSREQAKKLKTMLSLGK